MEKHHAHLFVCGLLYPAFLGAFIFEAFENFSKFSHEQFLLITLLLIHYSMDFIYIANKNMEDLYNFPRAFLDILSVFTIYFALKSSLYTYSAGVAPKIWGSLIAFNLIGVMWELCGKPDDNRNLAIKVDAIFCTLYIFGLLVFAHQQWALIGLLAADVTVYVLWHRIVEKFG